MKNKLLSTTAMAGALMIAPTASHAVDEAEFQALKEQMKQFSAKLESLENEQSALEAENAALKESNEKLQLQINQKYAVSQTEQEMASATAGQKTPKKQSTAAKSNGVLIPGTDTRLKVGGYIKVDAIHDFNVSRDGNGEDIALFAAIPLDGSDADLKGSNTRLHARQTRVNFTTTTPTEQGNLKLFLEGDFFGSSGSQTTSNRYDFNLRHVYGQLGGVLIGQTWSNYMDLAAYPESLDFVGVNGNTLVRQTQIRYTHKPEGSNHSYSVSIENPQSEFLSSSANSGTDSGIEEFPDFIARATFKGKFGHFAVKGVARKLESFNSAGKVSDDEFGYALGVSGKIKLFDKGDVRFQLSYGDGIGRYIFGLGAVSQAAGFDVNTRSLETVEAWGGYVSYRHWWDDRLRSNFMFGTTQVLDNPSFLNPATTNKEIYSAHGNLIWSLNSKVDLGMEYMYGYRETESGAKGELHRGQFSANYKF
jgi:regulator of replication initiation timing